MTSIEAWDTYTRWNDAIATVIYSESHDATPAYLDLDDDVLAKIANAADWDGDPTEGLRDAVAGVVVQDGMLRLEQLTVRRGQWMRDVRTRREPPPVLAFLAISVLAAEQMGADGSPYAQNAYYPWLAKSLGLGSDKAVLADVQKHYSARAEDFWGALNWWLEECDGRRGLPTAYALSHRYVGIPLSQALVRDGDRRKFTHFFLKYGLAPGMEIGGQDLEAYLGEWLTLDSCPASVNLKKLWKREATRARIANVVALELAAWDGTLDKDVEDFAGSLDSVRLLADLSRGFFGTSLNLMLSMHAGDHTDSAFSLELKDESGEWQEVEFGQASGNLRVLPISGVIDACSLLAGIVEMRDPKQPDAAPRRRHPRATIPLVFDEVMQAFVERERLQLNADAVLLVREDGLKGTLPRVVEEVLASHARPGWSKLAGVQGIPTGWAAFAGVQLFTPPLQTLVPELVPLARDLLTLAGGIRIPSRIRKWSAVAPPEIRVSLQSVPSFEVHCVALADDAVVRQWSSEEGALVVPLGDEQLAAGDYRVELRLPGAKDPLQQGTLRLRSGDVQEVELSQPGATERPYIIGEGQDALGAVGVRGDSVGANTVCVTGIYAAAQLGVDVSGSASKAASWMHCKEAMATVVKPVRVADPDPESCVNTGAHYLVYPTFGDGPKQKYISGECKSCGVVKRSPGWAWKAAKKSNGRRAEHTVDVADLPSVDTGTGRLWAGALDALRHIGAGSARQLTNLATQIEPGALFGGTLATTLETLGHIDVERDAAGTVVGWAMAECQVAVRPDGAAELLGYWPPDVRSWLLHEAESGGAVVAEIQANAQPPRTVITGLPDSVLDVAFEQGITVVDDPSWQLLYALPPLSAVAAALPRAALPGFKTAELFDTESASWVPTTDVDRPGAFRLTRGFERTYILRSDADVARREAARATVHLVKHLAAAADGRPLAVYLEAKSAVFVPRGCELPGLYGRALALASGVMPRPAQIKVGDSRRKVLAYEGLDRPTADRLYALINS
ncbi:hypothetical protein [Demequina sp.]|uniref:hypothetical protein n=1 Tax=Demequina sp. TaxID=2050685 RepID=UPI003A84F874